MTVCIAAICTLDGDHLAIVGACDRMLSAPDLKFEPRQQKVYRIFTWVAALIAGDPYAQSSICQRTSAHFAKGTTKQPSTVEEVAKAYAEVFTAYRREVAEARFLKPLGLDANSLLDRQQDFARDFVNDLKLDLQGSKLDVETIIVGIDSTGPHIYVVSDPGIVECHDALSFASIGTGKHHADSQFMMAKYTRFEDWRKALLLTYIAKRRSEVSPTVGSVTDQFLLYRSSDGGIVQSELPPKLRDEMERGYLDLEDKIGWLTQQAFHDIGVFIDGDIASKTEPPLPQSTETIPAPPPEEAPPPARRGTAKRKKASEKPDQPKQAT